MEITIYTVKEAAAHSGIAEANLHYHISQGNLPTQRFGWQHMILPHELEQFAIDYKAGRWPRGQRKQAGYISIELIGLLAMTTAITAMQIALHF